MPCAAIVAALCASQPSSRWANQRAALDQQLLAGLGLELAPERAGAARGRRVAGVGTVAAADQPRLAARGRARVAGLELVDERDLRAARASRQASDAPNVPAPTITALRIGGTVAAGPAAPRYGRPRVCGMAPAATTRRATLA